MSKVKQEDRHLETAVRSFHAFLAESGMGQPEHPEVVDTIKKIVAKGKAAGLSVGIGMAADPDRTRKAFEYGCDWAQCGSDFEYMIRYADQLAAALRSQ